MGGEWATVKFGDVIAVNPARLLSKETDSVYISMQQLETGNRRVSTLGQRQFKGSGTRFQNGDTLFARITPCLENGKTAYVDFLVDGEIAHGSTEFIVLSGIEGITDNLFVYYLARSPEFRDFAIVRMEGSSGRQRVPAPTLKRFTFACPPLPEQRAIAHILGSLDNKIELNRRMNETLEAMARAIFKSWFVDFDPVRVKAEGRDTGLPGEIADLFPDSFEDSELGAVPEGWKQTTIRDEFNLTMGQSPPGSTYNETGEGLPFFQGRRDFGFRYPANRVYCTATKRIAEHSDTLVSVRAPVGSVNMAADRCCVGRGVAGIRHKSGSRSYTYYAMHTLRNHFNRFEAEGTVFGAINKKQFEEIMWIAPPTLLVERFEQIAFPFDERIESNEQELATLATISDTPLPKLLSGELRVPDAEKFMEVSR